MLETETDKTLIQHAVAGNSQAFGELYQRYLEKIYRYIYFRVGNVADAEDLTEEVFIRAWEALPSYTIGVHPFTSWLYRIAHNLVIDHVRKRKPVQTSDDELMNRPSKAPNAEEVLQERQVADELKKAILQLDNLDQQVIILRFIEELSHREVSNILDITEGTSRVVQHRALSKMRQIMRNGKP